MHLSQRQMFAFLVQSLRCVLLFVTPWTAAHQAALSFAISQSLLKFMYIDAIQPFHPLSPTSPPALNLSQHQSGEGREDKSMTVIPGIRSGSEERQVRQGNAEIWKGIRGVQWGWLREEQNTRTSVWNLDFLSLLFQNRARYRLPWQDSGLVCL